MTTVRSRREVQQRVRWLASLAVLWSLIALPAAAREAPPVFQLTPLTERVALVSGGASNVVVVAGSEGLLLVDGGAESEARALLAFLAGRYPGRPVKVLFNTHWHLANTGLNEAVRRAGGEILAHENTRLWMSTVINARAEGRIYPPRAEGARPTRTFYDGVQTLDFDGVKVEYALLPQAHTDGDIYVRFPSENVIVAGDVVAPARYPVIDAASNGWLGGMVAALRTLSVLGNAQTRYVPGNGPPCGQAELKAQEQMGTTLANRMGESYYKGETWEQFQASEPLRDLVAQGGDAQAFLRQSYETAWYHVGEIRRVGAR
ncbi:MAG: MBL fold metallo-hydrolase [Proteobacteria bacterium]|nr:MAG: MBL fold metallo-hydrolase [Pseudomonadota bacterium]